MVAVVVIGLAIWMSYSENETESLPNLTEFPSQVVETFPVVGSVPDGQLIDNSQFNRNETEFESTLRVILELHLQQSVPAEARLLTVQVEGSTITLNYSREVASPSSTAYETFANGAKATAKDFFQSNAGPSGALVQPDITILVEGQTPIF